MVPPAGGCRRLSGGRQQGARWLATDRSEVGDSAVCTKGYNTAASGFDRSGSVVWADLPHCTASSPLGRGYRTARAVSQIALCCRVDVGNVSKADVDMAKACRAALVAFSSSLPKQVSSRRLCNFTRSPAFVHVLTARAVLLCQLAGQSSSSFVVAGRWVRFSA